LKKIGIVKVGTIPQVVSVVIDRLVYRFQQDPNTHVTGIYTSNMNESALEELKFSELEQGTRLSSISFSSLVAHLASIVEKKDILFLFYNEREQIDYEWLKGNDACRILLIPINLFNEPNPNLYPLGFDSAINEVVNNIDKVKDTAGSLVFTNKRLFLVKIPGERTGAFIQTAAKALECEYVKGESKSDFQQIAGKLVEKYQEGSNYALLLFNEMVNEAEIKEQISGNIDVDFRSVSIEEAQCIGGNPTVCDRVNAIELAENMVQWVRTGQSVEIVRLERNDQITINALH